MDLLKNLNEKQREAAVHKDGPLLILAGAGSGKTSTMTHRIANLIKNEGVSPYSILAVTFTNKAAGEMRDRVDHLIGSAEGMWIMTFHSACLRILRSDCQAIGYGSNFAVYDPTDQKTVMKNILKELNIDEKKFNPAYFLGEISRSRNKGLDSGKYFDMEMGKGNSAMVHTVFEKYEKVLKENNAMDFDDLLLNAVKLFEKHPDVLEKYRKRFRYIMVDEYQDTNAVQYRFIKLLAEEHKNLCVVGDDDQCIYQWRGADISNILDFEKDFNGAKVIKLEQNYRSKKNILEGAHSVIKNNIRKEKKLWTMADEGRKIMYYRAEDGRDEAEFVAKEIQLLKDADTGYRDFAILYRNNAQSRNFEEALIKRDIPYQVVGGIKYYDRKEIKDIMAYLRLVENRKDNIAITRVINEPKRGIGAKTLEKLTALAAVRGESIFESLCDSEVLYTMPGKSIEPLAAMVECIKKYSDEKDNLRVSDIYDGVLRGTGYYDALAQTKTVEAESRIENILEFKSVIYTMEEENPQLTLSEFMERVALLSDVDSHDKNENAVVLMTLHSAKGLEFPVVFMTGMEDGLFPGWRAMERESGIEEERRLCYVGMTRAKERLFMTGAQIRTLYGKTDYTRESLFMREIDSHFLEGDGIFEKKQGDRFGHGGNADGFAGEKPFKPFDSLKYARLDMEKKNVSGIDIKQGDRISHAKFGPGTVENVTGCVCTIVFDTGDVKKLAKDIAPIRKI